MALFARHRSVKSDQRKIREVVIEQHLLSPARLVVAALAILPELASVRVILLMTSDAGGCELLGIKVPLVTAVAPDACVRASQWKIGRRRMIEGDLCPLRSQVARRAF